MTNKNTLEQKSLNGNIKEEDFPKKLSAYCNACKVESIFEFYSIQQGFKLIPSMALYNCTSGCHGTKAYPTLMNEFGGNAIQ